MGHPLGFIAERNALLPLVHFIEGASVVYIKILKRGSVARNLTEIVRQDCRELSH
jgi:hypothetical protein